MRKAVLTLVVLVALLTSVVAAFPGCDKGDNGEDTVTLEETENGDSVESETTEDASNRNETAEVFFLKGENLISYAREVSGGVRGALDELLGGPTESEVSQGAETAIPEGVTVISYKVDDDTAKVDFSKELLNFGGGSAIIDAIITQITKTVLENDPTLKSVEITVEGVSSADCMQP